MSKGRKSQMILWAGYFAFVASALYSGRDENLLSLAVPYPAIKLAIWITFISFLAYSVYCSAKENLFTTIGAIGRFHWGRQIGIDLYLGLLLSVLIIFLHQGLVVTLLWLLPILLFGNLAALLYFAIFYTSLASSFIA